MEGLAEGTRTKDGDADKQVDSASVWFKLAPYAQRAWYSWREQFFQMSKFILFSYANSQELSFNHKNEISASIQQPQK